MRKRVVRALKKKKLFVVARGSEDAAAEKLYSSLGFREVVETENKKPDFFSSVFGAKKGAEKLMEKKL